MNKSKDTIELMPETISWFCRLAHIGGEIVFSIRTEWYIDRKKLKEKCRGILKDHNAQAGHYVLVEEEIGYIEEFKYEAV
jgi:hypothetical protein